MKTRIPHIADLRKWAIFLMVISVLGLVLFSSLSFAIIKNWELLIMKIKKVDSLNTLFTELGPLVLALASLFGVLFLGLFISKSYNWELGKSGVLTLDESFTSDTSELIMPPIWWVLYAVQSIVFITFSLQYFDLPNPDAQFMGTVIALFSLSGLFGLGSVVFMLALIRSKSVRFYSK